MGSGGAVGAAVGIKLFDSTIPIPELRRDGFVAFLYKYAWRWTLAMFLSRALNPPCQPQIEPDPRAYLSNAT